MPIQTDWYSRIFLERPISSLIHDDVLDNARRGMDSLNFTVGKKLAVLAGDFLLFRAFSAAVSLDNTEVVSLLATAVNNLVTGELMQLTITPAQRCRLRCDVGCGCEGFTVSD
ncbi:unnamed protein product [Miscanthus lutarioriparius]|uniref:Uncharacterized protein n=1 Tax=Miscanthus lutarioriparius TaxID=422564 RepID=A0A811R7A5_9POAL|nr:unnamed protein product [Miscanthus lutarioriparius]